MKRSSKRGPSSADNLLMKEHAFVPKYVLCVIVVYSLSIPFLLCEIDFPSKAYGNTTKRTISHSPYMDMLTRIYCIFIRGLVAS